MISEKGGGFRFECVSCSFSSCQSDRNLFGK